MDMPVLLIILSFGAICFMMITNLAVGAGFKHSIHETASTIEEWVVGNPNKALIGTDGYISEHSLTTIMAENNAGLNIDVNKGSIAEESFYKVKNTETGFELCFYNDANDMTGNKLPKVYDFETGGYAKDETGKC